MGHATSDLLLTVTRQRKTHLQYITVILLLIYQQLSIHEMWADGSHIKSAQMTLSYVGLVKGLYEPCPAFPSTSMSNGTANFAGEHR